MFRTCWCSPSVLIRDYLGLSGHLIDWAVVRANHNSFLLKPIFLAICKFSFENEMYWEIEGFRISAGL